MTTEPMDVHTIGNNTFAVFTKEEKGGVWMLQFFWGKKDFRIYLSRQKGGKKSNAHGTLLRSEKHRDIAVTNLQYLNAFEWYDYQGVAGHGLAYEETRWIKAGKRRYVELPKDFFDLSVELACRVFQLEIQDKKLAG